MDIKKCPDCAEDVKLEAKVCKHCGSKFLEKEIYSQKQKQDKKNKIRLWSFIGFFVVVGSVLSQSVSEYENTGVNSLSSNTTPIDITYGRCNGEMRKAVANEYKSPSTVKFISCDWDKSKGIYGEVDAQNGFGGVVRTSFLCNGDSCLILEK